MAVTADSNPSSPGLTRGDLYLVYPRARDDRLVRDCAVRDVAFGGFLRDLEYYGLFDEYDLVFKGGTSWRTCVFGHEERFSDDIDLSIGGDPDEPRAEKRHRVGAAIMEVFNGSRIDGLDLTVERRRRGYTLVVRSDVLFPNRHIEAKIDLSARGVVLPAVRMRPVHNPMHDFEWCDADYTMHVMDIRENGAEKMCRWSPDPTVRDVADLALFAALVTDCDLLAELYAAISCFRWATSPPAARGESPVPLLAPTLEGLSARDFDLSHLVFPSAPSEAEKAQIVTERLAQVGDLFRQLDARLATEELQRFARPGHPDHLRAMARARLDEIAAAVRVEATPPPTDKRNDPGLSI